MSVRKAFEQAVNKLDSPLACVENPDPFFPPEGASILEKFRRFNEAKKLCDECGIKDLCLELGKVVGNGTGIWGGVELG